MPEDLESKYPNLKEFFPFLTDLNKESHRGAVLIVCSFLDNQLNEILSSYLIDGKEKDKLLEGFNAPLGTLSARATAAFCLGLISRLEFDELELLRKIRNMFAHDVKATFNDDKIKNLCSKLMLSAKDYKDVVVDPFGKFTTAGTSLILNLVNRPHYVNQKKITTIQWPY